MDPLASLLVLAFASHPASPATGDVAAIMAPVIASEARIHAAELTACVQTAVDGIGLDEKRRELVGPGRPKVRLPETLYRWTMPSTRPGEIWANETVPAAEAQLLSEAAAAIIRVPAHGRKVTSIDAAWLPKPLTLCCDDKHRPLLTFSAPAVRGDIAFVETGYVCGGLCGNGLLYALRRTGSRWRIVSVVFTWIS